MISLSLDHWSEWEGWATASGLKLRKMHLGTYCNVVRHWVHSRLGDDPDAHEKFETKLWQPPEGVEATQGPWSPEEEMSAFASLKNGLSAL